MKKKTKTNEKDYTTIRIHKTTREQLRQIDTKNSDTAIQQLISVAYNTVIDGKKKEK